MDKFKSFVPEDYRLHWSDQLPALPFLERPIRRSKSPKNIVRALSILIAVTGLLGSLIYCLEGLPNRTQLISEMDKAFSNAQKQTCKPLVSDEDEDWCNPGNGGLTPSILLIGDSFSNSYGPMLASANEDLKLTYKQMGRGHCPALLNYGPEFCKHLTEVIVNFVDKTPSIETVALASNWPAYAKGTEYPWIEKNPKEGIESFRAALIQTLTHYQSKKKRVIIFLAPPQGSNPKSCPNVRPFSLGSREECRLSLQEAKSNDVDYRNMFADILKDFPNVIVFDPFPLLCNDNECLVRDGQKIFYLDGIHLSPHGAEFLARKGKEKLMEAFINPHGLSEK